ncbi:hypothetical protein [Arthrobacter sp. StoSoilB13]|uniref:hypothetical protein n=1 Tax=Arthrobacter sp. StoSoilB13 TaxID=2830993 RepID=UPI001CC82824|nr:hypothetical protein [Arthrobacter sp. StoSoilB13]
MRPVPRWLHGRTAAQPAAVDASDKLDGGPSHGPCAAADINITVTTGNTCLSRAAGNFGTL